MVFIASITGSRIADKDEESVTFLRHLKGQEQADDTQQKGHATETTFHGKIWGKFDSIGKKVHGSEGKTIKVDGFKTTNKESPPHLIERFSAYFLKSCGFFRGSCRRDDGT